MRQWAWDCEWGVWWPMRVLVAWCSKRGGTEGIGRIVAEVLGGRGFEVVAGPVEGVRGVGGFDAVILGGALYGFRWPLRLRLFVERHLRELRRARVWFFSSGPLDDSAERGEIEATPQVAALAELVGVRGHVTFGGRLAPDAKGFPASAMAKTKSGDWRNPERVRAWAEEVARALPEAQAGGGVELAGRSMGRVLGYGLVAWGVWALARGWPWVHLPAAAIVYALAGALYFGARGAREGIVVAGVWILMAAVLEALAGGGLGSWFGLALAFLAAWASSEVMALRRGEAAQRRPGA